MTAKTKTAAKATATVRAPAKDLMAKRRRMTIGASYISGVLGGFHRDVDKMVRHAHALKLGSIAELRKLSVETLRTKLATKIESTPSDQLPSSIEVV